MLVTCVSVAFYNGQNSQTLSEIKLFPLVIPFFPLCVALLRIG